MRTIHLVFCLFPLATLSLAARSASATPAWRPVLEGPEFAPSGGDLSVTVSARAERSEVASGVGGFIALAVPLDRLAAPRKLTASVEDASNERNPVPPAEPTTEGERSKAEPREEPALSAPLLARLAREAVAAAFRAHDVLLHRSELDGLATRARVSAALPELRFRVAHSNDQSLRLAPTLEDPDRYTLAGGNDLMLEASATWKLNRLVFADEEIAVERLELEREKNTEKLSERVLERLFDWHRAYSRLAGADPDSKSHGRFELERLEAEVELDVLTGGWFSETVRRFPTPRYKSDEAVSSSVTSPSSTSTLPTSKQ